MMEYIFHMTVRTSYALPPLYGLLFLEEKKEMDACFPLQDGYLCLTKTSHSIKYYYVLHTYKVTEQQLQAETSRLNN